MKKLYFYSILVVSSLAAGVLFGFGSKKLFTKVVDYNNVDFNAFIPDYQAIVKKVDSYRGSKKEAVARFSHSEIVNYSIEKFRTSENCATFTFGWSRAAVVDQSIRGCDIKNGNRYFEESLSQSKLVSVADRVYMTGAKSSADVYTGISKSIYITDEAAGATYDEKDRVIVDAKTYKATLGKTIDEMFIYLICDDGIISSEVHETNDGYQYVLELDTEISTHFNKLQMKNISNLDTYPVFKDVKLTFDLDKNLVLKKCNIDENYAAKKVISANLHAVIDIYFFQDTFIKIPELNEEVDYRME